MDERGAEAAANRCAELIVQLAGGRLLSGAIDVYPAPREPAKVMVRPGRVSAVLGVEVGESEVDRWLRALQLVPVGDGRWSVPSWRRDLVREIDCIEEIARLRGYDTIPVKLHPAGIGETAAISPQRRVTTQARGALSAHGFDEALNYSFLAEKDLRAVSSSPAVRVANPLTSEQGAMRTTLLAGLLRNVGYNLSRGIEEVKLYELGRVYLPEADARHPSGELAWPVHEPRRLGMALTGPRRTKSWTGGGDSSDFYDLKGAVEDVLEAMGISDVHFRLAPDRALHPASAAAVMFGEMSCGRLGQVHPAVAAHFDVPAATYLAEVDWEALLSRSVALKQLRGVPRFPAVARDLAFVVDASVPAEKLLEEIRAADSAQLLERVTLFDVYRGPPVPDGRKSVAFGLSLRAGDRTLTDAEADALCAAIRDRLKQRIGAEIRA
jgi:phenylalanyl-tRNA synthetase beta chain